MKRKTIVIGGGTFSHIRSHLSLAAPAFGTVANNICNLLSYGGIDATLVLTKMANSSSTIVTNEDLSNYIDTLIADTTVGTIVMTAAVCDFNGTIEDVESGSHAQRLQTKDGDTSITLTPADKIIGRIRLARPDIFLVGCKTTAGADSETQFLTALKFMKSTKCNLVLSNDVVTRNNMVITPEETRYAETTDRLTVLEELCEIITLRQNLTYHRTRWYNDEANTPMSKTPMCFQTVVQFLIDNGGFIENNGNGFTPGHFCYKVDGDTFYSSQRKANHNQVFVTGLTKVVQGDEQYDNDGSVKAYGTRKASVGATSQRMIFEQFPQYDCIVHTHNPKLEQSNLASTQQRPFQCGSLECGINTVDHMQIYDNDVAAVYLEKHGANILFRSDCDPQKVIDFITQHLELGIKVT